MSQIHPTIDSMLDGLSAQYRCAGDRGVRPTGVVEDSRLVHPGAIFIARPGTDADGVRFIEDVLLVALTLPQFATMLTQL